MTLMTQVPQTPVPSGNPSSSCSPQGSRPKPFFPGFVDHLTLLQPERSHRATPAEVAQEREAVKKLAKELSTKFMKDVHKHGNAPVLTTLPTLPSTKALYKLVTRPRYRSPLGAMGMFRMYGYLEPLSPHQILLDRLLRHYEGTRY